MLYLDGTMTAVREAAVASSSAKEGQRGRERNREREGREISRLPSSQWGRSQDGRWCECVDAVVVVAVVTVGWTWAEVMGWSGSLSRLSGPSDR